ncbi:MAG: hypothetical protein JRI46_12295, partial [Deltaproteobacteria bacterium]|nr:hypothetical protein [Deltaproteobacteria bacterium]
TLEGERIILKPVKKRLAVRLYGKHKDIDLLADLKEEHRREIRGELP